MTFPYMHAIEYEVIHSYGHFNAKKLFAKMLNIKRKLPDL